MNPLDLLHDLPGLVRTVSYFGLFAIVFAETGLLVGIFLPGDSLLITAGLLAANEGSLSLPLAILACVGGAVAGDSAGYLIGARAGPRVFSRPDSRWFRPEHVERARAYFERYGARTLVIARFVPVVRTFAPPLAGVARMPYGTFLSYNVFGGMLWGAGVPMAGYLLGRLVPNLDRYILVVVALVVAVSAIPVVLEWRRSRSGMADHNPPPP